MQGFREAYEPAAVSAVPSPRAGYASGSRRNRQRSGFACGDMPPCKHCRLGPPNPHPKIMKLSNQLGDFLNALKQSLFTTTTTHKRYLTKSEMQYAANTCTGN